MENRIGSCLGWLEKKRNGAGNCFPAPDEKEQAPDDRLARLARSFQSTLIPMEHRSVFRIEHRSGVVFLAAYRADQAPRELRVYVAADQLDDRKLKQYSLKKDGDTGLVMLDLPDLPELLAEGWQVEQVHDKLDFMLSFWASLTGFRENCKNIGGKELRKFAYADAPSPRCTKVVMSRRAHTSLLSETLFRDPDETGGVFLGHYKDGVWYVVEATDPGVNTIHSRAHHEMDTRYLNRVFQVLSRMYKKDLFLLGMWHRHPGDCKRFSMDDNMSAERYARTIGNGTLSLLINLDPDEQLTCYYLDWLGDKAYHRVPVIVDDQAFEGTGYLELNSEENLWAERRDKKGEKHEA